MSPIFPDRYTARIEGPFVVFLIGLLSAQTFAYWRGAALVQYWRSFEALESFSKNPKASHLAAWKRFNQAVGASGSVGIWHETCLVEAGRHACVYGNRPRFGLARAGTHQPATGARETASRRLGRGGEPTVPS